ncbi:hypothetical protein KAR34_05760 [bacterium]|nr:hypothetical protein [bacterium]
MNENVIGIDCEGKALWQIEKKEHVYDDCPYMNIYIKNDELWAGNWDGNSYKIDSKSGKIIERKFTK